MAGRDTGHVLLCSLLTTGAVVSSACSATPDRAAFPKNRDGHVSEYKLSGRKVYPETEGSRSREDGRTESLTEENSFLFVFGARSVPADGWLRKREED